MSLSYWLLPNYTGVRLGFGGLWLKMSCLAQDGGLPKGIKYYILYLACTRSGGNALTTLEGYQNISILGCQRVDNISKHLIPHGASLFIFTIGCQTLFSTWNLRGIGQWMIAIWRSFKGNSNYQKPKQEALYNMYYMDVEKHFESMGTSSQVHDYY